MNVVKLHHLESPEATEARAQYWREVADRNWETISSQRASFRIWITYMFLFGVVCGVGLTAAWT